MRREIASNNVQEEGKFMSHASKNSLTQRDVRHWNRLTREVKDIPPLEAFKVRLNGALGSLI